MSTIWIYYKGPHTPLWGTGAGAFGIEKITDTVIETGEKDNLVFLFFSFLSFLSENTAYNKKCYSM